MQKVIILKGLPGSGKSTWAKEMLAKSSGNFKRVNKDDLRAMIDDGKWSKKNEHFVLTVRNALIENALRDGLSVIVDDTNFSVDHEGTIKELAKGFSAEVQIKFFDTPLDECIERDSKRPKPVGEKVIRDMYNRYLRKEPEPVKYNPDLPDIVLCDIDGTVAKMEGRGPFEWSKVGSDRVNKPIADLVRKIYQYYPIIMFSGRDMACIDETENWLTKNNIPHSRIYMRPENDNRKDSIVKEEMYRKYIQGKYNVQFILDDRKQVVDMWRSLGLTCLQVADGNF